MGRAYEILANSATAFAAVHYGVADAPSYTFAHEIGHLQGARHNREQDSRNEPFQYGHGYINPDDSLRSIMGTNVGCRRCERVPYWSNPDINYEGEPLGTPTYEDNARVLSTTFYTLRDFKTLPVPSNVSITNENTTGENPNLTWNEDPDADNYFIYRCISSFGYTESCFIQVGSTSRGIGDINQWEDGSITMEDPYGFPGGECSERAYYYVTASNNTGESGYQFVNGTCTELN